MKRRWIIPVGTTERIELELVLMGSEDPQVRFTPPEGFAFQDLSLNEVEQLMDALSEAIVNSFISPTDEVS